MSPSFHNKILRVDLSAGTLTIDEPGIPYLRRYMGGWNIIAHTLLTEVPTGSDALGPDNRLVFAPSVLTGLALSGASRNAVGAKSPLTGGFGAGEVGGFFGAELKHAGFDAIIVHGVAPEPVYLWIHDGEAELRSAKDLWGQPTKETQNRIREELQDRRIQCALIGPGGENMVRYANIMNGLRNAAGRCGLGAVMGSKRLKAVAVRGTHKLEGERHEIVKEMAKDMAAKVMAGQAAAGQHQWGTGRNLADSLHTANLPIRNYREGEFAGADNLSAEVFMPLIGTGMEGCYACAVRCKKSVQADAPYKLDAAYGGPEYESVGCLGSCCGIDEIVTVSKASQLCNAYSLDTISAGATIAMAMECFENGILSLNDTDGIDLRFGNGEALMQIIEKIARREGIGDVLAEGPQLAARRIGQGAERFAVHAKNQGIPAHEARFKRGLAISYAISPTGADHQHALHDAGLQNSRPDGLLSNGGLRGLGVLDPVPLESLGADKVRATLYQMTSQIVSNCLTMCNFLPYSLEQRVSLVNAATGWDISQYELMKVGERALTLARLFNMREGLSSADDRLGQRLYEPMLNGPLADGGIDPAALEKAMHLYYEMAGWDGETGVPTPGRLHELGVSWAIQHIPQSGRIANAQTVP